MSVDNTTVKQSFSMDGSTTEFTFTFNALHAAPTDIKCKVISAAGAETDLTYSTDYTVAVNIEGNGGIVTVVDAQSATDTLFVYRDTTDTQESDYNDYNQFPADTVERDFDRRTLKSQELEDAINRAVKFSITSDISDIDLPTPVDGKVLVWSGTGGALSNSDFALGTYSTLAASSATVAQNAASSASTSQTAAAASQAAAAISAAAALVSQNAAATSASSALDSEHAAGTYSTLASSYATNALAQANIATTQATIATTQATIATTQATLAASSATVALEQANVSTTQATLSASSATVALEQANIATTQATIATTQATIATTQATIAQSHATTALGYSLAASTSATLAASSATVAQDIFDGLSVTTPGSAGCSNVGIAVTSATPTFTTQCDFNKLFGSAGRCTGGEVTSAGTASINVAAGTGFIKATDDDTAELLSFDWVAASNLAVATNSTTYVYIDYNGGVPTISTTLVDGSWDLDTSWPLAVVTQEHGECHILNNPWWVTDGTTNIIERLQAIGKIIRDSDYGGLILSSTTDRRIAVTAGKLWSRLNEIEVSALATNSTVEVYWRTSSTIWAAGETTTLSTINYNNLATNTLDAINNNKYVNWWIYCEANDGAIALVYPQAEYNSSAEAEAESPPTALPNHILSLGILIGRVIMKQGQTAPVETQSAFTQTFTATQAADHGNLTGLSDDDHTQYVPVNGTRPATISTLQVNTKATIALLSAGLATAGTVNITTRATIALASIALATVSTITISAGTIAGAVTGVTQSPSDNSTKLATTAYVDAATPGVVSTFGNLTVTTSASIALANITLLTATTITVSSGTIAGAVTGTTQSPNDNSTKLATTAYADAAAPANPTFGDITITTNATISGHIIGGDGTTNPNNLLTNGNFELWSAGDAALPDGWNTNFGAGTIAKEDTIIKLGTYSCKYTAGAGTSYIIADNLVTPQGTDYFKSRTVSMGCWVYATSASTARIGIGDSLVAPTYSDYHTGDSTWQWLTVTKTMPSNLVGIDAYLWVNIGGTTAYFDGAILVEGSQIYAFGDKFLPRGGTIAADADESKFSHKIPVIIDGTQYYIMLTQT